MNSNADSEDVLRVGGFYMLLDLTLTSIRYLLNDSELPIRKQESKAEEFEYTVCNPKNYIAAYQRIEPLYG